MKTFIFILKKKYNGHGRIQFSCLLISEKFNFNLRVSLPQIIQGALYGD